MQTTLWSMLLLAAPAIVAQGSPYAGSNDWTQDAATIYLGVDTGLARSTDGGENWTTIPGGLGRVTVLALDPQDPDTVYAGGQGGLFAIRFAPVPMSPQKVLRSHIYD